MEKLTLDISRREEVGSRQVAKLRKEGILPVVVYARGKEAIKAAVNTREFITAAKKARTSNYFVLKSSDSSLNNKCAFVKEIQQNHLKKEVLHVDFFAIDPHEKARVLIPVEVFGESDEVKNFGAIMTISTNQVTVEGVPAAIPEVFKVNISKLRVGQHIRVSELELPEGVEMLTSGDQSIVSLAAGRKDTKGAADADVDADAEAHADATSAAPAKKTKK